MSTKLQIRRQKWALDNTRNRSVAEGLAAPPAFSPSGPASSSDVSKKTDVSRLITKKSWDLALAPLKQVPMNLFIMYMAGNSISIFPIMMVGMLLMRPVQAIFATKSTFKMVENSSAFKQMFVYILGNCINIGLALYKCQSMGLLPTHSSDWLAFVEPPVRLEYLGGGVSLL
ncbi:ER membrane protein complex subunit 4 [Tribolium castaneum]|uniref:ER membrane protein complex subunit 4 n=1 Tax=Tribolium castaneum TaxID=7070 RepID=D6WMR9_TRICA|nr:PREDICTED: ER membrane protein complex subunit 4 [Tribolium castaneum]EFA04522.2 ER membrane protein complex subunit 4-like Protein [Tribolium castaneum]|eukprot:XP_015835164.1 PREDICTED: ER membrane protein complex subunit 4 [Tribolium castaneum]